MTDHRRVLRAFYSSRENLVYRHHGRVAEAELHGQFSEVLLDKGLVEFFFSSPRDKGRRKRYLQYLRGGQVGVLIHQGESWASIGWLSTPTSSPPPHVPFSLARGAYWLHNQHTAERFRGRGLHKVSLLLRLSRAFAAGPEDTVVLTDVAVDNHISRRSQESVGFSPAGMVTLTTMGIPKVCRKTWGNWDRTAQHPPISWSV